MEGGGTGGRGEGGGLSAAKCVAFVTNGPGDTIKELWSPPEGGGQSAVLRPGSEVMGCMSGGIEGGRPRVEGLKEEGRQ